MGSEPLPPFALIGIAGGTGYRARLLRHDIQPSQVLPAIQNMWTRTCGQDTAELAKVLLGRNWSTLNPDVTAQYDFEHEVPGAGRPDGEGPDPVEATLEYGTEKLVSYDGSFLDFEWLYLLRPGADVVEVYEQPSFRGWEPYSRHHLGAVAVVDEERATLQPSYPIHQWVPASHLAEVHPGLAGRTLAEVHLALSVLAPGRMAVIDAIDECGEAGCCVWVIGAGHLIRLRADIDEEACTAELPRPLGGAWHTDPPAVLVTPSQVAEVCDLLAGPLAELIAGNPVPLG